jgi:formate C-acetyltransferase
MHERFGRECGATPDGRKSGMPFADGGGPAQGREKSGPTSSVISTVSWDHSKFIGGIALNMKFSKNLVNNDNGRANLKNLITTYLKNGGFELQINVLDNKVLKKAEADPDQYRDLVVRIGGYTDYFTRLSSEMRKEVMLRTEFSSF